MEIIGLRYGNTNTYFCGGLLIDTDMAGTMNAFRRELKRQGIRPEEIRYVFATHYHPDHMGLIGELMQSGVGLLLPEHQKEYVHFSDGIFRREKNTGFVPVDGSRATVITAAESREFLRSLGIAGQIVPTGSHSPDGAALVLDSGDAFVGDLEPYQFLGGYDDNPSLRDDWALLLSLGVKTVRYGHFPDYCLEQ